MTKNKKHPLIEIIKNKKNGIPKGIFSICSSNEYVIEASMMFLKEKKSGILIESTCNQVNQFGGYTGMRPRDFVNFIISIAERVKFPREKIILGGDHLGPNPWKTEKSIDAMEKACFMVKEYALAGYSKIHLDASMSLADDLKKKSEILNPELIALRAAKLCQEVEKNYSNNLLGSSLLPVYIVGTEVPSPGGTKDDMMVRELTVPDNLRKTIELNKNAFYALNLKSAWERVIAVVVNLGIEFNNYNVIKYDAKKAQKIIEVMKEYPALTIEAHSTDYQSREAISDMVNDGVGILKVGPALTFAFREAVFSLCHIEKELYSNKMHLQSNLIENMEKEMNKNPKYWMDYYIGNEKEKEFERKYSFLDRSRYYWNVPTIRESITKLLENMNKEKIPLALISQFMPIQYCKIREGVLKNNPKALIFDHIYRIIENYYFETWN